MAILIGLVVAVAAVLLVLDPILRPERAAVVSDAEPPEDPKDVKKELALAALKEIEFDRATGKLSDTDYTAMLARYTKEAVEALREADRSPAGAPAAGNGNGHRVPASAGAVPASAGAAPAGAVAGDDPVERLIAEARKASQGKRFCTGCGALLEGSRRFCTECGARI